MIRRRAIHACRLLSALLFAAGCGSGDGTKLAAGATSKPITFTGGHETDSRDNGRPVVLIGSALGVTPEVFRDAFSRVNPAVDGKPSEEHARANKKVLMDALGKHGISNERLDQVSNYYRYQPKNGQLWQHTPATATAVIEGGKVTGFTITNPGAGYTVPPTAKVAGHDYLKIEILIGFSTDFDKNGGITSMRVLN